MDSKERIRLLTDKFKECLEIMGVDLKDPHLVGTPYRIAKMYVQELLSGLYTSPPKITLFDTNQTSVIVVDNLQVKSLCAHHFMPFYGTCRVEYKPTDKIIGLSKFQRIIDHFSKRPQIQEILTTQICEFIFNISKPEYVEVTVKAKHMCLTHRGVKSEGEMTTRHRIDRKENLICENSNQQTDT